MKSVIVLSLVLTLNLFFVACEYKTPTKKEQEKAIEECPDLCSKTSQSWLGNAVHPTDKHKFLACWHGTTMGCGVCQKPRYFDAEKLRCVWPGGLDYDPMTV
uniref:Chitin-binding type-2 domain-containing protein n=1 Tax=Clytia hemisphaerica TaxID=252671 RepID=A0A7M5X7V0_9CNID